jgi:uncharacterized protein (DUF58 family)
MKTAEPKKSAAKMAATAEVAAGTDLNALLSPSLLRSLDRMALQARRSYPGSSMGERLSSARGQGMEFSDYKEYSRGDDFRSIDWRIYARLNQLVVKTFETEENLPVLILLDCSASMDFGSAGRARKSELATALAGALGYIARVQKDNLSVFPFSNRLHEPFDATRQRGTRALFEMLSALKPEGESSFVRTLRDASSRTRPGICFVISDFCAPDTLDEGLKSLAFCGHELMALHVWDPLEANPALEGEVDIVDAESGEVIPMTVKGDTVQRYRDAFEAHCLKVAKTLSRYNARYLRVSTEESVEQIFLQRLRREGLVR